MVRRQSNGLSVIPFVIKNQKDKQDYCPIVFEIYLNKEKGSGRIFSGMKVKDYHWSRGRVDIELVKHGRDMNEAIQHMINHITAFYWRLPNREALNATDLVRYYNRGSQGVPIEDLCEEIKETSILNQSKESTINKVEKSNERIKGYFEELNITDVSQIKQQKLVRHLKKKMLETGGSTSVISDDLHRIKSAFLTFKSNGVIDTKEDFKQKFNLPIVKKKKYFLKDPDIRKFEELYKDNSLSKKDLNCLRWTLMMFYTGVNFDDMKHSFKGIDSLVGSVSGNDIMHFELNRKKTGVQCLIPLTRGAESLIEHFNGGVHFEQFTTTSDFNNSLKRISKILGYKKAITSMIPRRTYGNLMIQTMGIDTTQKAMGHKTRKTTEEMYEVTDASVCEAMWQQKNIYERF